jgi:hypothetical protein
MEPSPSDPPLSIEPVLGWRVWRLRRRADGVVELRSVTRDDAWPPGTTMTARCDTHRGATVPSRGCRCGLYAAASPQDLARSGIFTNGVSVIGAIAMWGTVVEHERGARSRLAYPARLRLVCGPCLAAGKGAVDPKVVARTQGGLTALCDRHAGVGLEDATPAAEVQAELLASYGVELMPIQRLARTLRSRPVSPWLAWYGSLRGPAFTIWSVVRILFGGLFMLWAFSGLLLLALAIVVGVFQTVTQALGFSTPAPSPSMVAPTPVVVPAAPSSVTPEVPPFAVSDPVPRSASPVPQVAIVCGKDEGERLTLMPCDIPADLIGFAERATPERAARECVDGWDAYSHGEHYRICWIDLRMPDSVRRWTDAPNPWSIPVRNGGAVHEHR